MQPASRSIACATATIAAMSCFLLFMSSCAVQVRESRQTREPIGLAYSADQAARGKAAYQQLCASCHGTTLNNGQFGAPLNGGFFQGRWSGYSAAALLVLTSVTMPPDQPDSLGSDLYRDLVAYILQANGVEAGAAELPADPDILGKMILPW